MKFQKIILLMLISVAFLSGCFADKKAPTPQENTTSTNTLNWEKFSEKALQENKNKKPVLIYFWAEWCTPCHQLRKLTFTNLEVKELLKDFALYKVDSTNETPETLALQEKYKVESLPVVVFINKDGSINETLTLRGFEPPLEFVTRLQKM